MSYVEVQGQYSPNRTVAGVTSSPVYYRIVKHFSDETLIRTAASRGLQSPTWIKSNLLRKTQLSQILRFVFSILTAFATKINFGFSVFATVTSIWGNSYVPTDICRTPENRYVQEPFSLKSDINNYNRDNKHSIFSGTVPLTYFSQLRPWVAVNLVNSNPFFSLNHGKISCLEIHFDLNEHEHCRERTRVKWRAGHVLIWSV